jgi:hypothetical protein
MLAVGAGSARAQQSSGWLEFKAPFAFTVEQQKLPAGEYRILVQDGWVQIQSRKGETNTHILTMPIRRKNASQTEAAQVVFHNYGTRYFLAEVWVPGSEAGRQTLESKEEQALAKEVKMAAVVAPIQSANGK